MKYLYPCKPNPLAADSPFLDELDRDVQWIGEIKKNGWRCLVHRERGLELWTRHKTTINEPLEALRDSLMAVPENTILDGELIHFRTQDVKGVLYLFDILFHKGRQLTDLPLADRRKVLEDVYVKLPPLQGEGRGGDGVPPHASRLTPHGMIELAAQVRIGKKALYHKAITVPVNEGVVLKKLDSKYLVSEKRCLQNPFWLKVKRPEKHVYVGKEE